MSETLQEKIRDYFIAEGLDKYYPIYQLEELSEELIGLIMEHLHTIDEEEYESLLDDILSAEYD